MPAQPAQPLLASTLFNLHKARQPDYYPGHATDQAPQSETQSTPRKRRKLETGWKAVDGEVLQGGLDYGEGGIVCLSAGGSGAGNGNGEDGGVAGLGDEVSVSVNVSCGFWCFVYVFVYM